MSNTADCFRISPQQRRLFHLQSADGVRPFISWIVLRWPKMPATPTLAEALKNIVGRYEVLRTRFEHQDGIAYPVQTVAETADCPVALSSGGESEAQDLPGMLENLNTILGDPNAPGLFCRVLQRDGVSHLLLAARSTILDRQSLRILTRDLGHELQAGGPSQEDGEPIQYIDFSEWCYSRSEAGASAVGDTPPGGHDLVRWRAQLHLRDDITGFDPEALQIPLDPDLGEAIHVSAQRHAVSVPAFLLGAWTVLMSRWSGDERPLVGYSSDGRRQADVRKVVGPLATTIPFEVQVSDDSTFAACVEALDARIRSLEEGAGSFRWDEIPGAEAGSAPVYSPVCFETDLGDAVPWVENSGIEETGLHSCSERFDLKLFATGSVSALRLQLHYNRASCHQANVESIALGLVAFLRACVAMPSRPIGEIHGGTGLRRLPASHSGQEGRVPGISLLDRWQDAVENHPNDAAVAATDGTLTFAELDRSACALARRLAADGVRPGDCVMMLLGRTAAVAVAIWGILKAGAAYVPMDPASPAERVERVLADAGITTVVVDKQSSFRPQRRGCRFVVIDRLDESPAATSSARPTIDIAANSPAYVIYTSGSTGTPKGVMISHGNLTNYLDGLWERVGGMRGCSAAIVSSLSMDLGNTTFFSSLCSGGTVHLLPYSTCTDAVAFANYMAKHSIECLKIVPSHLASLLTAPEPRRILPSRYLICGGEKLSWKLVEQVRKCGSTCEIYNHYGPTETTVGAVMGRVPARSATDARSVPLGTPLRNYDLYLVGKDGAGVHRGFPGELCIAGAGVALKYVGGAPLRSHLGDGFPEVYRTGDVARVSADGSVEYLRRNDGQVKISGYRIELGEIEVRLQELAGVRRAVVKAFDLGRDELEICAFIIRTAGSGGADLKAPLAAALPPSMLPSVLVEVEAMPLNANGKIDGQALRELAANAGREAHVENPETADQHRLLGLWQSALGARQFGIGTDFFSRGGTSLKAIGLVAAINREFGVKMSLADIFDHRTIRAQAAHISGLKLVPHRRIVRVEDREWYPASSAQQRMYVVEQLKPGGTAYNMPGGVEIRGRLDRRDLERAFTQLIERHEILRTAVVERENGLAQRIAAAAGFELEYSEDSDTPADAFLGRLVRPFDLSRPPLARAHLVKRGDDRHFLFLDRHHVTSDNVSSRIFVEDLFALYRRQELPPVGLRYRDYAVWEQDYLGSSGYDDEVEYWRQRLDRLPADQPLVLDRPRPRAPQFPGAVELFELTAQDVVLVDQVCVTEKCTRFAALMAAYRMSLHCLCDQADIVLGTDIANREQDGMQKVMGILVNQLAIRTEIRPDLTVRECIGAVAKAIVEALRHQQLPFDQLVKELHPDRDSSLQPIFKNKFVLTEEADDSPQFAGLDVRPLEVAEFMSKFDTLTIMTAAPQRIRGSIQYNRELFNRSTVTTWIESLLDVIDLAFVDLDLSVGELRQARQRRHEERLAARGESLARAKKNLLRQKIRSLQ